MIEFDMVIIGSGVGLSILEYAIQNKLKCAIVENSKFGGTCLTKGCIPSKVLVAPCDMIREAAHSKKIGVDLDLKSVDWKLISKRMWKMIDQNKDIENSLTDNQAATVYKGTAEFTSPFTMKVKLSDGSYSEEFKGAKFVVAAGGRSFIPPIEGLHETGFVISETFFGDKFPEVPWKSLVIIGGGAIGAEFAHVFSALGTAVTVIELAPHLLSTEEEEISVFVENEFAKNSINVKTKFKAIKVEKKQQNKIVTIQNIETLELEYIECEEIFVSSGIRSNADILKVEKTGIKVDEKGWIITNEFLETNVPNIWAVGDINGKFQFRHKANYEAEILSNNIFYKNTTKKQADYSKVPWAIFTHPQVAHVGITQKEALKNNKRILIGKNYYSEVVNGYAMGYEKSDLDNGFVKVIADENMKILGVHIAGPHAAILIQSFVYFMNIGYNCKVRSNIEHPHNICELPSCPKHGTLEPLYTSMVIHPSLSELTAWVIGNLEWLEPTATSE
jgi:dihydrolipoamide dehydrogenase